MTLAKKIIKSYPHCHEYPGQSDPKSINAYPPEILVQGEKPYNYQADIYSLGILICHLSNGLQPFSEFVRPRLLLEKLSNFKPIVMDSSNLFKYENCVQYCGFVPEEIRTRTFSWKFHDIVSKMLSFQDYDRPLAEFLVDSKKSGIYYNCGLFADDGKNMDQIRSELPGFLHPIEPAVLDFKEMEACSVIHVDIKQNPKHSYNFS